MAAAKRPARRDFSALVVAGTHSGVGKTSVTLGLVAALRRRGLAVQPFKVGPDFIDPLHHAHAAGRPSHNLDGWMLDPSANRAVFARAVADADVAVVEGVMGLFDGSEGGSERGSTAEMAKLLDLPVVLVVDASAVARSAAAIVHGFTTFDPELRVAGAIANNVGGAVHAAMIRDAVPLLGALPHVTDLVVPERHLGLHRPHEARSGYVGRLADLVEEHIDVDALLAATAAERPTAPPPVARREPRARIGVARDEAFCFYYADNLELLEQAGAELVEFSPLRDPLPAGLDGLYLGGGYPELHAAELAANRATREAIRAFDGAIYAECGGLMYLGTTLSVDGRTHEMCGVVPFGTRIPAPMRMRYAELTLDGVPGRGHEFHFAEPVGPAVDPYVEGAVHAGWAHLHLASNPALADTFVTRCLALHS